jgi:digeranylgeranylglycerophospholipid reductase
MTVLDALVVGAGPAGSTVALELAKRGHAVRVVEEHPKVGFPVQCAGLVSSRVLEMAQPPSSIVRKPVQGATVVGPSGGAVVFKASEARAFVIDRGALDVHLADRAARAGAVFSTAMRFDGTSPPHDGTVAVRLTAADGSHEEVRTRLVVGADGVASAVARAFRLRRPVEILPAFEAEFPESPGDPDQVEVYLGREICPGLFGWWIPDGTGGARVGVAVTPGPVTARAYYDRLVAVVGRRFGAPLRNPVNFLVSGIPIGTVPRTATAHALLVGDAAAQVKPLSGGGIYTGMRCAQLAAEVAHEALQKNDLGAASLERYDRAWRAELGTEFARALYLRRVLLRLSDADLDRVVAALSAAELTGTIVAFGDIDFPSHVARQLLLRSPSLVRFFPKALGALWGAATETAPELELGPRRK